MDTSNREYRTVVLGGLLHDIGKLLQRGSFGGLDIKGKHPAVSANFISAFADCFRGVSDPALLKTLVQKHHESRHFEPELNVNSIADDHVRTLASLVSLADNLSSSERGEHSKSYQDYKETPLGSVLERANSPETVVPKVRFHPLALLDTNHLETIFPSSFQIYEKGELNRFIKVFGEDFSNLFKTGRNIVDPANFDSILTHLHSLLAKYAWCLASDTQEVFSDVSLFDHLRTTSSIASCLYLWHSSNNSLTEKAVRSSAAERFLLVTGDVSGIQDYIFHVSTTGAGGVARRLRARSIYVQLCTEVASHLVLRRLELPITVHTLMNSGGHFYLLLPNTDDVKKSIQASQKTIDEWFLQELNGELALSLAAVPFGEAGFKTEVGEGAGFGNVMKSANELLDRLKKNRFASALQTDGKWREHSFEIPVAFQGEDSCQSCRKFPAGSNGLCKHCATDREVGRKLPGAKYLSFCADEKAGEVRILGVSVSIDQQPSTNAYQVVKINDTDLSDLTEYPATFKYIARTVPGTDACSCCQKTDSNLATFECIARRAEGANLLGFLKMDIDNLGETFIFGLKPNDSISRVSTMSRMFDLFFAGWIEHLAEKNDDVYTVFSGGDDLFLVGPWDLMLEIAERIRADFQKYTNNPKLAISAGVAIDKHNYPIANAADDVEAALYYSKANAGKDSVTVLGRTLKWAEWHAVAEEWSRLKDVVAREKVPAAFLYGLLNLSEMWRQYRNGNVLGLRYHPLLSYTARRNINPNRSPETAKWAEALLSIKPADKGRLLQLDNLGLVVELLIMSTTGGKE